MTGTELMSYVSTNIATYKQYPQSPEIGVEPRFTNGDFVFGQVDPAQAASLRVDSSGPTYGGLARPPINFDALSLFNLSNRERYLGIGKVRAYTEYGDWECSGFTTGGDVVVTSDSCADEDDVDFTPFNPDFDDSSGRVGISNPRITLLTKASVAIFNPDGTQSGLYVVPLSTTIDPSKALALAADPKFPDRAILIYHSDSSFSAKIPDCNLEYSDKAGSVGSDCVAPERTEASPFISADGKVVSVVVGPQQVLKSNDGHFTRAIAEARSVDLAGARDFVELQKQMFDIYGRADRSADNSTTAFRTKDRKRAFFGDGTEMSPEEIAKTSWADDAPPWEELQAAKQALADADRAAGKALAAAERK
ncbi:hypothetical protein [Rhizobium leguminosarum]|uniref:hypothetical protein n=1 Tax=Rhizobium leguminosarum TaxID=384 RepID=UPI003512AC9D